MARDWSLWDRRLGSWYSQPGPAGKDGVGVLRQQAGLRGRRAEPALDIRTASCILLSTKEDELRWFPKASPKNWFLSPGRKPVYKVRLILMAIRRSLPNVCSDGEGLNGEGYRGRDRCWCLMTLLMNTSYSWGLGKQVLWDMENWHSDAGAAYSLHGKGMDLLEVQESCLVHTTKAKSMTAILISTWNPCECILKQHSAREPQRCTSEGSSWKGE